MIPSSGERILRGLRERKLLSVIGNEGRIVLDLFVWDRKGILTDGHI